MRAQEWSLEPREAELIRDSLVHALAEMGLGQKGFRSPDDLAERRQHEARVWDITRVLAGVAPPHCRGGDRLRSSDLGLVIAALRDYGHRRWYCALQFPVPDDDGEQVATDADELADALAEHMATQEAGKGDIDPVIDDRARGASAGAGGPEGVLGRDSAESGASEKEVERPLWIYPGRPYGGIPAECSEDAYGSFLALMNELRLGAHDDAQAMRSGLVSRFKHTASVVPLRVTLAYIRTATFRSTFDRTTRLTDAEVAYLAALIDEIETVLEPPRRPTVSHPRPSQLDYLVPPSPGRVYPGYGRRRR